MCIYYTLIYIYIYLFFCLIIYLYYTSDFKNFLQPFKSVFSQQFKQYNMYDIVREYEIEAFLMLSQGYPIGIIIYICYIYIYIYIYIFILTIRLNVFIYI